ncbi:MAG TPA: hypothetical protein VD993_18845 [Chitinophagaceae bacterium]|nr:hypothetical protein [Chitinophagaceae bacterium]
MSVTITIKDETTGGKVLNEIPISFDNELVTVRDIVKARVTAEVQAYNNKQPEYFRGLVQPTDAEQTINGFKLKERRKIDPEKQFLTALDAFKKNAYFVLIDSIQSESLEQMVVINSNTDISFVKLTPLVGG